MASLTWHTGKNGTRYAYAQGYDREGTRWSRRLGAVTPEEAMALKAKLEAEIEGREARPAVVEARDALARFLDSLRVLNLSPKSVDYYAEKLGAVFAGLAPRPLKAWRPVDLDTHLAARARGGLAPATIAKVIGACRRFVAWGREKGYDVPDFTRGVKKPKIVREESEPYNPDEIRAIIREMTGKPIELPIALALYAGLSQGDLYAITWEQVDLKAGVLRRRRAKDRTGVVRPLPIIAPLAEVLRRHQAVAGPVCRDLPRSTSSASKALHRLLVRAGVEREGEPRGGWHRFRHTYATTLAAAGVDVATVAAMLQHRPGSPMTLRYVHSAEGRMREAAKTLGAAFGAQA